MTNLRGKHKQIYNLVVKEVDPQVNWAALVDEKLVRPRLQLCAGWTPPCNGYHGPASEGGVPDVSRRLYRGKGQGSERCSVSPRVTQQKWWRWGPSCNCSPALVVGVLAG